MTAEPQWRTKGMFEKRNQASAKVYEAAKTEAFFRLSSSFFPVFYALKWRIYFCFRAVAFWRGRTEDGERGKIWEKKRCDIKDPEARRRRSFEAQRKKKGKKLSAPKSPNFPRCIRTKARQKVKTFRVAYEPKWHARPSHPFNLPICGDFGRSGPIMDPAKWWSTRGTSYICSLCH